MDDAPTDYMIKVVITIEETPNGVEVDTDGRGSRKVTPAEIAFGDKLFEEVRKVLDASGGVCHIDTDFRDDPLN